MGAIAWAGNRPMSTSGDGKHAGVHHRLDDSSEGRELFAVRSRVLTEDAGHRFQVPAGTEGPLGSSKDEHPHVALVGDVEGVQQSEDDVVVQ